MASFMLWSPLALLGNVVTHRSSGVWSYAGDPALRRAGTPAPCQDHLEDDAHRPLKHYWTGLRRRAERAQSQQQSLGEQGIQHGVRRQLKNDELGDDRSSVQPVGS